MLRRRDLKDSALWYKLVYWALLVLFCSFAVKGHAWMPQVRVQSKYKIQLFSGGQVIRTYLAYDLNAEPDGSLHFKRWGLDGEVAINGTYVVEEVVRQ